MTDDGQMVKMTQHEYEALIGRVMRSFMTANHVWDFPWQGARLIYVEQPQRQDDCMVMRPYPYTIDNRKSPLETESNATESGYVESQSTTTS